jgi:aminocarboxymuconate-semialdehyde decarboxylase
VIELDVHAHLAPIDPQRLASIRGASWDAAAEVLTLDGDRVAMRDLFHPERLLRWMDDHEVGRALVSIPPPLYRQGLSAADAQQWCAYANDGLAKIAQDSNGRLSALMYLPLEHPELALRLAKVYEPARFGGFGAAAGGHAGILLSLPGYRPLWEALDRLQAFLFLHPGHCTDVRLEPFYLENLAGNPMETGVAAAHLVMAGIPASYPGIRFCLAHAGGTFPAICGRLQQGQAAARPGVPLDVEPPLQAARRLYADGIAHHPGALRLARDVFGDDHMFFGSDWPFAMGILEPQAGGA